MAHSEIIHDALTGEQRLIITLNKISERLIFDSIAEAFKEAGRKFVEDNKDKILAELKTENIEKYVAEYVAKNLELNIQEKENA